MYWIVFSVTKLWKILAKFFCKYIHIGYIYNMYKDWTISPGDWNPSNYLRSACKVRWLIHKPYSEFTRDKPHGVLEHQGRWRAFLCTRTEPLACSPSLPVAVNIENRIRTQALWCNIQCLCYGMEIILNIPVLACKSVLWE